MFVLTRQPLQRFLVLRGGAAPPHRPAAPAADWPCPTSSFRASRARTACRTTAATRPAGTCPSASTANCPASALRRSGSVRSVGKRPHSNFVSARMMPRVSAYSAARRYTSSVFAFSSVAVSVPTALAITSKEMFSSCCPSSAFVAGVKIGSGSLLASLQARSAAGCRTRCRAPGTPSTPNPRGSRGRRTRPVPPSSSAPASSARRVPAARNAGGKSARFGAEEVVRHVQPLQPEQCHRGQHRALARNAVGHHPVERADAVGGDDGERVAEVVHVAHLAAPRHEPRHLTLQQRFGGHKEKGV